MQDVKQKAALSSIAASAGLTIAKGIVGLATGSLAILSEAAHSLLDLAATLMTYFAVRVADKPADAEHHYGHGKIESVSALAETALLFLLSGAVVWEAFQRLGGSANYHVETTPWSFAVIIGSILVDFFRPASSIAWPVRRRARRWKRTRCISAPTCGHPRRCSSDWPPSPTAMPRPTRPRRSWSRCSSASPAGGWAGAPSIR